MKRSVVIICGFAAVLGLILGCLLYVPDVVREEEKKIVCIMNPGQTYWAKVRAGMEQASSEFGVYTKYCTFERFHLEEQLRLLDAAMYMQVDGIITLGEPNASELNEKIAQIEEAGIPVVLIDTDAKESGRSCYIGSDNYQAGWMAAQKMLEEAGQNIRAAVFTSKLDYANQQERVNGFCDAIAPFEDAEVVEIFESDTDKIKIQQHLKELFEQDTPVNAIFCTETASTLQVGLFFENSGNNGERILIGFDDEDIILDFVRQGIYTATMVQESRRMGYEAVRFLDEYQPGQAQMMQIYTDVICLTADDVEEYLEKRERE